MMRKTSPWLVVAAIALPALLSAENAGFAHAKDLYQQTDYAGALRVVLAERPLDAASLALAGKSSFMQGQLDKAGDYFQKALALEPGNAEYILWVGRTWGRKAEGGNPFTAPAAASRARELFEKAVELDPYSSEATGDLFDFYLDAPGLFGGGIDKAEVLAHRIQAFDPAEGQFDLARIAAKRKQPREAEQHFREAVKLAPRAVGHVIALARFLARQGRLKESDALLAEGEAAAPGSVRLLYGRAAIDIETHRNIDEARHLLERYLASSLTPDDPPREAAQKLLRQAAGM